MSDTKQFIHFIDPHQTIDQLKHEILTKDPLFFTLDFNHVINENNEREKISIDDFWKLAKIKAKKVSLFVNEILSCDEIETAPKGFIREITMPGSDITQGSEKNAIRIKERVVIDENTKTILFFQLESTGKILLYTLNEVIEKNNKIYFVGHYVAERNS